LDFGIYIEALEEATDGLKQIDESIIARRDVIDTLYTLTSQGLALRNCGDAHRKEDPHAGIYHVHEWDLL